VATCAYNGVHIDILRVVACRRRAICDGPTYLWSEWFVHVKGILNPFATSYNGQPNQEFAAPGSTPALTDETIRHKLMQPRKKLVLTTAGPGPNPGDPPNLNVLGGQGGTLVLLDCPPSTFAGGPGGDLPNFTGGPAADQYLTDAQNGPFPSVYNVVRIDGLKTIHIEFAVTARVNECFSYYSSPAVLLSHRWTQSHNVDRDAMVARTVRGHAIFRSDVLLNMRARPDDFRAALMHPIGRNCERQNVRVVAHEDSCRIDYVFTDQEVSHNLIPAHVSRIEAFATVRRTSPSTTDVATEFWREAARRRRGGGFLGGLIDGILPYLSATLVVRAWGTRRASRRLLRNVASQVFVKKLPDPFAPGSPVPMYSLETEVVYDLMGRYVELRGTMTAALPKRFSISGGADADEVFPDLVGDDIDGVATTADRPGRMAVLGNTSRGTWLEACVAQALQGPCENSGQPVNSGYVDRTLPVPGVS
jgi:hypothetical protein